LGTTAKNQITPENVDASPTHGFVGKFPLPQNPTGNSSFGSYLPVQSKVLAFETLPPSPSSFPVTLLGVRMDICWTHLHIDS